MQRLIAEVDYNDGGTVCYYYDDGTFVEKDTIGNTTQCEGKWESRGDGYIWYAVTIGHDGPKSDLRWIKDQCSDEVVKTIVERELLHE